jgi:predicted  nucleic acid-binding Zn-ribbon protein
MTITVPGMRSNKLMSMDIDQLRGWAAFMDRAMIVSLAAAILAVTALGITTWLSFRFGGAVRLQEQATLDRYKAMESQAMQRERDAVTARDRVVTLENEVSAARERTVSLEQEIAKRQGRAVTLEQEVSTTRERTVALEQEVSGAKERTAALEREAAAARERAVAFEQAAREANERVARTTRESAVVSEKARAPQFDAAEIQQRLADLGKLVREAAARAPEAAQERAAETPRPVQGQGSSESTAASRDTQPSPIVSNLRKYAGTKAAVFVVQPISDAQAVGSAISASLGDAGWAPQTWTWTGVAGIFGVVVLIREGSDPATNEAASALLETLRSDGFNVTKGDWPADWRRYRGTLDGPQTPAPTDAPIRIVIGAKPR